MGTVAGTEKAPDEAEQHAKFSDRALAMIALAIDTLLLYLLGDPVDPVAVWKKLPG